VKIRRFYKQNEHQKLEETFIIQQPESVTLCNLLPSASKTHLDGATNESPSESSNPEQDTS